MRLACLQKLRYSIILKKPRYVGAILRIFVQTRYTLSTLTKLENIKQNLKYEIPLLENEFGMNSTAVLDGAKKAVLTLYDTYKQDINTYIRGEIYFEGRIISKTKQIDHLKVDDLLSISMKAFYEFKWFQTSIYWLKHASRAIQEYDKESNKHEYLILKKAISVISRYYDWHLNNQQHRDYNLGKTHWNQSSSTPTIPGSQNYIY